jgi:hypothetical protein
MKAFALLFSLAVPAVASADYLWATLEPSSKTVAIGLQEWPGQTPLDLKERAPLVKAWIGPNRPVPLQPSATYLKGAVEGGLAGAALDYGAIDRRDQGRGLFWLEYFAKAALTPEASQTKLGLPVELFVKVDWEGRPVVTVLHDGKPAKATIVADTGDKNAPFNGETAADGTITLPPVSGPLAVRAFIKIDGAGTHDGKMYDFRKRYGSLTISSLGTREMSTAQVQRDEAFTRILSASFGKNHEIVSQTPFIETVLNEKLTKPQLLLHLRQRELVHRALDAILSSAPGVPYEGPQKEVLALLDKDILALGSTVPTASEARPLTKEFLRTIEESRSEGPYFALGVFHVYYGGITNGGRQIGAMIGKQVGVEPSYYLKSDGYRDYLAKVNLIEDPIARSEMIRGGKAAYAFIIASNREPEFGK